MELGRVLSYSATWILLIVCIVLGRFLGLNYYNAVLIIIGWLLLIFGFYIHYLSHKEHPKAFTDISNIDYIAIHGIYGVG